MTIATEYVISEKILRQAHEFSQAILKYGHPEYLIPSEVTKKLVSEFMTVAEKKKASMSMKKYERGMRSLGEVIELEKETATAKKRLDDWSYFNMREKVELTDELIDDALELLAGAAQREADSLVDGGQRRARRGLFSNVDKLDRYRFRKLQAAANVVVELFEQRYPGAGYAVNVVVEDEEKE
jgi:hypothetical protein